MTGFASGKYAYRISDRSGFRYRLKDTRKESLLAISAGIIAAISVTIAIYYLSEIIKS